MRSPSVIIRVSLLALTGACLTAGPAPAQPAAAPPPPPTGPIGSGDPIPVGAIPDAAVAPSADTDVTYDKVDSKSVDSVGKMLSQKEKECRKAHGLDLAPATKDISKSDPCRAAQGEK